MSLVKSAHLQDVPIYVKCIFSKLNNNSLQNCMLPIAYTQKCCLSKFAHFAHIKNDALLCTFSKSTFKTVLNNAVDILQNVFLVKARKATAKIYTFINCTKYIYEKDYLLNFARLVKTNKRPFTNCIFSDYAAKSAAVKKRN